LLLLKARKYLIEHSIGPTKDNDGKTEKTGKPVFPQKKLVQETEGNEENRHSDPDSNKMKINYAKVPNEAHKNNLK
jgi:hypothetical protein